jgi:hypothetical protein
MHCDSFTEHTSQLWNNADPYSQEEVMDKEIPLISDMATAGTVLCKLRIVRERLASDLTNCDLHADAGNRND